MPKRNLSGSTLIELLIVAVIAAVLMSILLPAVMAARGAARRLDCQNRMRQLGLALSMHADTWKTLPPGTSLADENMFQGWYGKLLPYLDDKPTFEKIEANFRRSRFAFDVSNHPEFYQPKAQFGCPEDSRMSVTVLSVNNMMRVALTSYQGCLGQDTNKKDGVLFGGSKIKFADVLDGLSNTIAIGERPPSKNADHGWWYAGAGTGDGTLEHTVGSMELATSQYATCPTPSKLMPGKLDNECDIAHYWSLHPGVVHFVLLDGSVRGLSYGDQEVLNQLATRAGM